MARASLEPSDFERSATWVSSVVTARGWRRLATFRMADAEVHFLQYDPEHVDTWARAEERDGVWEPVCGWRRLDLSAAADAIYDEEQRRKRKIGKRRRGK